MSPRRWFDAAQYGLRLLILREKLPFFAGLVLTDRCNLHCFYCQTNNLAESEFSFEQAKQTISNAYQRGHRFLYLTGGEPTLWTDGTQGLVEIVAWALEAGFYRVYVYTNGTRPLDIDRCIYVVTVDGPKRIHDSIRGGTWDEIMRNVATSPNRCTYTSITLTKRNVEYLEEYVREITATGLFRGITFNLLTHQPDFFERFGFTLEEREQVLDQLWRSRRRGYPIKLSRAAYRALRANSWKRPITQIEVITSRKTFQCCRDVGHPAVCATCGYSGCAEVAEVLRLRTSAIWEAIRIMH